MRQQKGWAKDLTANRICEMKIRAVGLANPIVKWLDQNLRGIKDFYEISMK